MLTTEIKPRWRTLAAAPRVKRRRPAVAPRARATAATFFSKASTGTLPPAPSMPTPGGRKIGIASSRTTPPPSRRPGLVGSGCRPRPTPLHRRATSHVAGTSSTAPTAVRPNCVLPSVRSVQCERWPTWFSITASACTRRGPTSRSHRSPTITPPSPATTSRASAPVAPTPANAIRPGVISTTPTPASVTPSNPISVVSNLSASAAGGTISSRAITAASSASTTRPAPGLLRWRSLRSGSQRRRRLGAIDRQPLDRLRFSDALSPLRRDPRRRLFRNAICGRHPHRSHRLDAASLRDVPRQPRYRISSRTRTRVERRLYAALRGLSRGDRIRLSADASRRAVCLLVALL